MLGFSGTRLDMTGWDWSRWDDVRQTTVNSGCHVMGSDVVDGTERDGIVAWFVVAQCDDTPQVLSCIHTLLCAS